MDAHQPVTLEERDRYPLVPPVPFRDSTEVVQDTVNVLVVGSIPTLGANFCSYSIMVMLRAYTSAMPLDEGMILVRIQVGVPTMYR